MSAVANIFTNDEIFELSVVEVETLRRAAQARGLDFDPDRTTYTRSQLSSYGLVREGYTRSELRSRGIRPQKVSSLDVETEREMRKLPLETPYGAGIEKCELPIDMLPLRVAKTVFPPNTSVSSHVHPPHTDDNPGGSVRIVVSGAIVYEGRTYRAGDWFFIPNGEPYEFSTDPNVPTIVFYTYRFFGAEEGNRFSHPDAI